MSDRRGFTILELLIALGLLLGLLTLVVLVARHFLFTYAWTGETLSGIHEAALIETTLRHDLSCLSLTSTGDLDLRTRDDWTVLGCSGGSPVAYRHDPLAHLIWRQEGAGAAQALGMGLVRDLHFERVFLKRTGPRTVSLQSRFPETGRPFRAGVRVVLALGGSDLAASGISRTLKFTTHVFPVEANLQLASIWRRP